jgi:hypothetical protein
MSSLADDLRKIIAGDVADDDKTKELYSHDASLFELVPDVVVSPKDSNDVCKLVEFVKKNKAKYPNLSLTARGAGTDMSGGAINTSIIVDFKKYFTKIETIDAKNKFSRLQPGVMYKDFDENTTHEVETIQGAFFLTRKNVLDKVNWLDEGFIFDGEDLDLSYQISKLGLKIIYYPDVKILHLKGATKGKIKETSVKVDPKTKLNRVMQGVNSMEYFYRKNLWNRYPTIFNYFVLIGIKFLKFIRFLKFKIKN